MYNCLLLGDVVFNGFYISGTQLIFLIGTEVLVCCFSQISVQLILERGMDLWDTGCDAASWGLGLGGCKRGSSIKSRFKYTCWKPLSLLISKLVLPNSTGGGHLWGRTPVGVLPHGFWGVLLGEVGLVGTASESVSVVCQVCRVSLCVGVCTNKDNSWGRAVYGARELRKPGTWAPVSFLRTVRHNILIKAVSSLCPA